MTKITEDYRRGYRAAVKDAAGIAFRRGQACEEAARQYAPDSEQASTERCAALGAMDIHDQILKLRPKEK